VEDVSNHISLCSWLCKRLPGYSNDYTFLVWGVHVSLLKRKPVFCSLHACFARGILKAPSHLIKNIPNWPTGPSLSSLPLLMGTDTPSLVIIKAFPYPAHSSIIRNSLSTSSRFPGVNSRYQCSGIKSPWPSGLPVRRPPNLLSRASVAASRASWRAFSQGLMCTGLPVNAHNNPQSKFLKFDCNQRIIGLLLDY
jgi:hypothetical protein